MVALMESCTVVWMVLKMVVLKVDEMVLQKVAYLARAMVELMAAEMAV